jgi:hypothetical protein
VLGYLSVDFGFVDRPTLNVNLSVIVRRVGDGWLISHYRFPGCRSPCGSRETRYTSRSSIVMGMSRTRMPVAL